MELLKGRKGGTHNSMFSFCLFLFFHFIIHFFSLYCIGNFKLKIWREKKKKNMSKIHTVTLRYAHAGFAHKGRINRGLVFFPQPAAELVSKQQNLPLSLFLFSVS